MSVKREEILHPEYGKCLRISNPVAELFVTLDYGPRIIHYSFLDGPNMFFVNKDPDNVRKGEAFDTTFYPGAYWNIYGGNRIWVSPHSFPHAFYPDHVSYWNVEMLHALIEDPYQNYGNYKFNILSCGYAGIELQVKLEAVK